ncbi:ArsR/SmtB family transcription factor [Robertkochia solimangrovi]|uniref:ArsR/SmtB family transcription factor n=1 Tax=Robertkochia solimangrovi TaxID=2213046 RepID=UPI00117E85A6|nr:metalloregulator ArsR/SmtB family transcription factor [Robertkochia solimangrovi]TRZ43954.1 transcriptional regulator [Robertkochia solimangrovi]
MGFSKNTIHTLEQNDLGRMFKALGHPARVAMLQYISINPDCICNDMVSDFELAQSTISQHLSELKKIGVIDAIPHGKKSKYRVNIDRLYEVKQQMSHFFNTTHENCF